MDVVPGMAPPLTNTQGNAEAAQSTGATSSTEHQTSTSGAVRKRSVAARALWGLWLLALARGGAGECGARRRRLSLTLRADRNATGHRRAQLSVVREGAAGGVGGVGRRPGDPRGEEAPLLVQLEHGDCPGGRFLTLDITAALAAAAERAPAAGYEWFAGLGSYKMHAEGGTWAEARAACEAENAHLVVLNSEAEAQVLVHMYERVPKLQGLSDANHAFIGFHDFFVEGQFITIFGDPINETGFTRWSSSGQPDNYGFGVNPDSDCGGIHRNGGLNDLPCNWKCVFFCEQPIQLG